MQKDEIQVQIVWDAAGVPSPSLAGLDLPILDPVGAQIVAGLELEENMMAASPKIDIRSETVRQALLDIAQANRGVLSPEAVVEAARDEASAIHDYFTWDPDVAHHQYLLAEAACLIRRVKVQVVRQLSETEAIVVQVQRQFQSRPSMRHSGGGYESVEDIMSDDQKRQELLQAALRELEAFERRYAQLQELAEIFQAIRKTIRKDARESA